MIILMVLVTIYILVAIFVSIKYLSSRQRFSRFQQSLFLGVTILFIPGIIFLVVAKFDGIMILTWKDFFCMVLGLIIFNLLALLLVHLGDFLMDLRLSDRSAEIARMPDSPTKLKMEKEQEYIEKLWKNR